VSRDVDPNVLMELGARIRAIREERGLRIDDIVETTRIRKQFLEGIEGCLIETRSVPVGLSGPRIRRAGV